ncbi:hypothetical protein EVAR_35907_1 [Eumeta japonica]|uniref:Uncharacterized protein n=1 Tax=Eumeta variegata TaxID=151549 RepID=A0A4C1WX55_EUMVA|nr:hypothetical protein EVAR_35907_1 [Eumeta japonica]
MSAKSGKVISIWRLTVWRGSPVVGAARGESLPSNGGRVIQGIGMRGILSQDTRTIEILGLSAHLHQYLFQNMFLWYDVVKARLTGAGGLPLVLVGVRFLARSYHGLVLASQNAK